MFSPKYLTNRRQFLERTALGAGSMLFLPELLTSCNDHRIPDPGTSVGIPPVVGAAAIDWNDDAKIVVTTGLRFIPEVGGILSALVSIFWPNTQVDVWAKVKDEVESIVNQKIADLVYQNASSTLGSLTPIPSGLIGNVNTYLNAIKNSSPSEILNQWQITSNLFQTNLKFFQSSAQTKGYELPLLGLFTQYANMYLAILRDVVVSGKSWGRTEADQKSDVTILQNTIKEFINYTLATYSTHLNALEKNTPRNDETNEPFTTVNRYTRQMTFAVLDFMNTWVYYDVTKYPKGATVTLPREVYSDPQGSCVLSGPINLVSPPPTKGPSQLTVWAFDRIDAVQLTYPRLNEYPFLTGPGLVETTPRMGDQPSQRPDGGWDGGTSDPPYGGKFTISPNNPIVGASAAHTDFLIAIVFRFLDGTFTNRLGGHQDHPDPQALGSDPNWVTVPDHFISRIHINGVGRSHSADCVVYGFLFLNGAPTVTPRALGILYVTSPKELSGADIAQAFPTYGITDALITDELKAARQAYWTSVKARAEAPK